MNHDGTHLSASTLAATVLMMMDLGHETEARELLTDVAGAPSNDQFDQRLRESAVRCAMGIDRLGTPWSQLLLESEWSRRLNLSLDELGHQGRDGGINLAQQFRVLVVRDPEILRPAQTCLRAFAVVSRPPTGEIGFAPVGGRAHESQQTSPEPHPRLWITSLLSALGAQRSTTEKATLRALNWAKLAGLSQREVAASWGRPQTQVHRELKAIEEDPTVLALTPRELHEHFVAGHIDRVALLSLLSAYPYEGGQTAEDEPDWGYHPGSMDELAELALDGALSKEEFEAVLAGSRALASSNG